MIASYKQLRAEIDKAISETNNHQEKMMIVVQFLVWIPDDEMFLVLNDYPELISDDLKLMIRQEMIDSLKYDFRTKN